jgi:glycosyltransferase involved in cell wall biosynthesis
MPSKESSMISALMVTQPARLALARCAIGDFLAQTYAARELVIVHDGDSAHDTALLHGLPETVPVRVHRAPSGSTLGALRNLSVDAARGTFVCQWDDDDRYHPQRLALQSDALSAADANFCFLSDQLHWFPARGEMFWDDWNREPYPFNVVQGTLFARRECMPRYRAIARGEDTSLLIEIFRRGDPIARVRDNGWCYVYVYHGANVFAAEHHHAISQTKRLRIAALMQREQRLRERLSEYRPGFGAVRFPHEAGFIDIDTTLD